MPNTAKGTPYVISTDLVADYPTTSSDLADHIDDNLAFNAVTINAQTGTTYTFALADASAGKLVTATNAASQTYTVPPQSSVTWADGAVLRILNQGAGVVTIAAGAGVTINGTPLTLNQYSGAALQRTASDTWTIIPFTGGVGNANFSDAATGTYSSGGVNYKYITYTASGTLTVTSAGFADILVVGGGGGGGRERAGGGGAGGYLSVTNAYLSSGTLTVTVGAGGAGGSNAAGANQFMGRNGDASRIASYFSPGGGGGYGSTASGYGPGVNGGSGGGAGGNATGTASGGTGTTVIGNNGGPATIGGAGSGGGGGGGASAVGGTFNNSGAGAAGGAGTASTITGASVTYAGGGGGSGATAGAGGAGGGGTSGNSTGNVGGNGTANTGGGGGGNYSANTGGSGGSGVVIIRVAV